MLLTSQNATLSRQITQLSSAVRVGMHMVPHASASMVQEANDYCCQIKTTSEGWKLCLSLLRAYCDRQPELISQLSSEVLFFALQVLEEVIANRYSELERDSLPALVKETLLVWLKADNFKDLPVFIKNKLATVVVQLFKQTYPQEWPTFFTDILQLLQMPDAVSGADVFVRICVSIDQEVVCKYINREPKELERNSVIKDVMREDAVARLVEAWKSILERFTEQRPDLAVSVLNVISLFTAWIDINLVVTTQFVEIIFCFLKMEALKIAAANCLIEIVNKGMQPINKLKMLQSLNLQSLLSSFQFGKDYDFDNAVAQLVSSAGHELCVIHESIKKIPEEECTPAHLTSCWVLIEQFLQLMLSFLSLEYNETNGTETAGLAIEAVPFLTELLYLFRAEAKRFDKPFHTLESFGQIQPMLYSILISLVKNMRYPETYQFSATLTYDRAVRRSAGSLKGSDQDLDEDDQESAFLNRRNQMKILYDFIFGLDQPHVVEFTKNYCIEVLANSTCRPFNEIELALYLIYHFGEAIQSTSVITIEPNSEVILSPLGEMLVSVFTQLELNASSHPTVVLTYFETIARYCNCFSETKCPVRTVDFLSKLLFTFVGPQGVHHSIPRVQQRVWYLFAKFAKSVELSKPLLDRAAFDNTIKAAVDSLRCLLIFQAPSGSNKLIPDKSSLFEAAGILAYSINDTVTRTNVFQMICDPLLSEIREIMVSELYKSNDIFFVLLNQLILSIGYIGKGLPEIKTGQVVDESLLCLEQSLFTAINVLQVLPQIGVVREACRLTFQLLTGVLGPRIIPALEQLVRGLLYHCSMRELTDINALVCTLIHKSRAHMQDPLHRFIMNVLEKMFFFLSQPLDQEDLEALSAEKDLRNSFLTLLMSLLTADMDVILLHSDHLSRLDSILVALNAIAIDLRHPPNQKLAFSIATKLFSAWYVDGKPVETQPSKRAQPPPSLVKRPAPPDAVTQFFVNRMTRSSLEVPLNPKFDVSDAQYSLVQSEIAVFQKSLAARFTSAYFDFLVQQRVWNVVLMYIIPLWIDDNRLSEALKGEIERTGKLKDLDLEAFTQSYCQSLMEGDLKSFKQYFKGSIKGLRYTLERLK